MSSKSIIPGPVEGQHQAGLRRALRMAAIAPVVAGSFAFLYGPVAHADEDAPVSNDETPTTDAPAEDEVTPTTEAPAEEEVTPTTEAPAEEEEEVPAPATLLAPEIGSILAGKGSLLVSWTQPAQEGKIPLLSTVYAKQGDVVKAVRVVLGDAHQATLSGLTNGQEYDVTVITATLSEISPASIIKKATPLVDGLTAIKPAAVQNLDVEMGDGSAVATWDAPATDGGSPILGYVVATVDRSTKKLHSWRNVASDVRSASINGLKDGIAYDVSVFPVNLVDFGAVASKVNLLVNDDAELPALPEVPWFNAFKDGDKVTVNFGAITEHGIPALGYNILLVQDGVMKAWATPGVDARAGSVGNYDATKDADVYVFTTSIPGFGSLVKQVIPGTPVAD
jgi:hypothetical protein